MYPAVKPGDAGRGPASHPLPSLGSFYPTVGQGGGSFARAPSDAGPASTSAANGPGATPGSPARNPLLRVQIAEGYRTLPPVSPSGAPRA